MATAGDADIIFCVTEVQIADLFTKILSGGAFNRLSYRFDYLGPWPSTIILFDIFFSMISRFDVCPYDDSSTSRWGVTIE
jgi:hypothetical protein